MMFHREEKFGFGLGLMIGGVICMMIALFVVNPHPVAVPAFFFGGLAGVIGGVVIVNKFSSRGKPRFMAQITEDDCKLVPRIQDGEEFKKNATHLRGWHIYRSDFHDREHWVAKRGGVGMNHPTKKGLMNMILSRPY